MGRVRDGRRITSVQLSLGKKKSMTLRILFSNACPSTVCHIVKKENGGRGEARPSAKRQLPALPRRVLHDLALLHHEGDAFGRGDVGSRVARNGDDVCEFAFFQAADFLSDAE